MSDPKAPSLEEVAMNSVDADNKILDLIIGLQGIVANLQMVVADLVGDVRELKNERGVIVKMPKLDAAIEAAKEN